MPSQPPEWLRRQERGNAFLLGLFTRLALLIGRRPSRFFLPPICLYFMLFSSRASAASRQYLSRALGRTARMRDLFRHYHCFASCVLDRVFLLRNQKDAFDIRIFGESLVNDILTKGTGCILVGAHMGSFEVLRVIGRNKPALRVRMLMFEENARKVTSVLNAIAPDLVGDTINLGKPDSFLQVQSSLAAGEFVGILADRSLTAERKIAHPFLGVPASFSVNPFRIMGILRVPVVLMIGLYQGGNRYDVHFEPFMDARTADLGRMSAAALEDIVRRYVERLEHYARLAPYNWFNFFDLWR